LLLHPERQDQDTNSKSKLDAKIVALDAVGCLFFILPGLIAFIVDFNTKTIYLSEGEEVKSILGTSSDIRSIDLNDWQTFKTEQSAISNIGRSTEEKFGKLSKSNEPKVLAAPTSLILSPNSH